MPPVETRPPMPPCEEKRALLNAYHSATAVFSQQLTNLHAQIGTSSKGEYESMRRSVDEARVRSEETRLALDRHVAEHGC